VLLEAFEPEGVAAAESLAERLEASRGQLEACIRGATKYAVQHTLGLVKTHLPEADLDPVGDGVPEDCPDTEWEANHTAILEISECIMAELYAAGLKEFVLFLLLQRKLVRVDRLRTIFM